MAIQLPKEEIVGWFLSDMNRLFSEKKNRNRLLVVSDTILEVIGHKPASDIDVFEEYLFSSPTDHAIGLVFETIYPDRPVVKLFPFAEELIFKRVKAGGDEKQWI
ncbi:hypothetical protein DY000_02031348 [Brassica cretica]|uniref:Uncharacterized protein n=1 Tax=Brassica cretica TaxID=69181 RepID=A0ABQ7DK95_BRACR|nr:hypothetical protein DY000_02031348 [Brassica cretica]